MRKQRQSLALRLQRLAVRQFNSTGALTCPHGLIVPRQTFLILADDQWLSNDTRHHYHIINTLKVLPTTANDCHSPVNR